MYAGLATVMCILLGFPLAYFIAIKGGRYKTLLLGMVVLPFFVTYLVRTLAWKILLFDEVPWWRPSMPSACCREGRVLLGKIAVVGALTYNFLPFMVLPIYVGLEKMDRRLLEAASDLYGSRSGRSARSPCRGPSRRVRRHPA